MSIIVTERWLDDQQAWSHHVIWDDLAEAVEFISFAIRQYRLIVWTFQ